MVVAVFSLIVLYIVCSSKCCFYHSMLPMERAHFPPFREESFIKTKSELYAIYWVERKLNIQNKEKKEDIFKGLFVPAFQPKNKGWIKAVPVGRFRRSKDADKRNIFVGVKGL